MIEHPDKKIRADEQTWKAELAKREHAAAMVAHEGNIDVLLRAYLAKEGREPVEYRLPSFGCDDVIHELGKRYRDAGWNVKWVSVFSVNFGRQTPPPTDCVLLQFS